VLEQLPLPPGTPVTVLTVSDDSFPYETAVSPGLYGEAMTMYEQSREEANRQANAVAAAAVARLDQAGFQANAIARSGDPAHEIVAHANEYQARLLVLGTRGHTGLRRLMLGSVARNVLLHAPCSVLVVRENVAPPADGDELVHLAMSER
jgi:nucleotide-binding universal stress UspA family protein